MDLHLSPDASDGNHVASLEGAASGGFITPRALWQEFPQCLTKEATGCNAAGDDQSDRGIGELWQFAKGLREHVERVRLCAEQANQRADPRVLAALVARVNSGMEAHCVAMCKEQAAMMSKQMAILLTEVKGLHSTASSDAGCSCKSLGSTKMEGPVLDAKDPESIGSEAAMDDLLGTRLSDTGDLQATLPPSAVTLPDANGIAVLQQLNDRMSAIENSVARLPTAFADRGEVEALRNRLQSVETTVEAIEEQIRRLQGKPDIILQHAGCVEGKTIQHVAFGQFTEDPLLPAPSDVEDGRRGFGRRRSSLPTVKPSSFTPTAKPTTTGAEPLFGPVPATQVSPCKQRSTSVGQQCSTQSDTRPSGFHNHAGLGGGGAAGPTAMPAACCHCCGAAPAPRSNSCGSSALAPMRNLQRHQFASMEALVQLSELDPHGGARSPSPVTSAPRLKRVATAPLPVAGARLALTGYSFGLSPPLLATAEAPATAAGAPAAAAAQTPAAPAAAGPRCAQGSASWAGPPHFASFREARQLSRDGSGIGARLTASPRPSCAASRGRRGAGSPAAARSASPTSCGEPSPPPRQDPHCLQGPPQLQQQHSQLQMMQQQQQHQQQHQQQPLCGRVLQQSCGHISLGVGSQALRPSLSPAPLAAWRRASASHGSVGGASYC